MDIAQWEQQFDQSLESFIDVIDSLFTEFDLAPEEARTKFLRARAKLDARLEERACIIEPQERQREATSHEREDFVSTVSAIVDVGDQTWVPPLAIVEHTGTGRFYVDPRFRISDMPSDSFSVELVVTDDGLVASGPVDRHRLREHVERSRFRPLLAYRAGNG